MYVYICIYVYAHTLTYIYIYINMYMRTHIYESAARPNTAVLVSQARLDSMWRDLHEYSRDMRDMSGTIWGNHEEAS